MFPPLLKTLNSSAMIRRESVDKVGKDARERGAYCAYGARSQEKRSGVSSRRIVQPKIDRAEISATYRTLRRRCHRCLSKLSDATIRLVQLITILLICISLRKEREGDRLFGKDSHTR